MRYNIHNIITWHPCCHLACAQMNILYYDICIICGIRILMPPRPKLRCLVIYLSMFQSHYFFHVISLEHLFLQFAFIFKIIIALFWEKYFGCVGLKEHILLCVQEVVTHFIVTKLLDKMGHYFLDII